MEKLSSFFAKIGQILSGLFFVALLIASILFQTVLPMDGSEFAHIYYFPPAKLLFLILFVLLLSYLLLYLPRVTISKLLISCLLAYTVVGLVMIYGIDWNLAFDARVVWDSTKEINDGLFSSLYKDGYLYRYPHQLGLITLERVFHFFVPFANNTVLFIVNLIMILLSQLYGARLTWELFRNQTIVKIYIVLLFVFLPQLFSTFFVYGLVPGTLFSLISLVHLSKYIRTEKRTDLIISLVGMSFAYLVRNNFIILIIATIIVLILFGLGKKTWKAVVLATLLFVLPIGLFRINKLHYENIAGNSLTGVPKITWVTMGLNDTKIYNRLPGWYDAYVETLYGDTEGNFQQMEIIAKKDLDNRIRNFSNNPSYASTFFLIKFISTWTDGNFQTLWSGPSTYVKGEIKLKWVENLYSGKGIYNLVINFGHYILIIIYLGLVLAIWQLLKSPSQANLFTLIPVFYLVGGILFHLVWETKSQYAYPYIILALPVSAFGLFQLGYLGVRLRRFGQWYLRQLLQVFSRNN
ncbi:TPA: hypothetical protein ACGOVU_000999 [Streptococcus suis]